jgi:hypothetical protein
MKSLLLLIGLAASSMAMQRLVTQDRVYAWDGSIYLLSGS